MFEANTINGISNSDFQRPIPGLEPMVLKHLTITSNGSRVYQQGEIDIDQRQSIPANGYKLNLAVRYDNGFANKFGTKARET